MLKNKVIVVIGSEGLLGKEFVKICKEHHAEVVSGDIIETKDTLAVDITNKESIIDLVNFTKKRYGKIDAVINAAYPRNKNYGAHFFDVEYKDFCENVDLHLGGYFLVTQQFASYFKEQGYGNIINIASIYGVVAPKFEIYQGTNMTVPIEYSAIKSAIIHMTGYIAKYLKEYNIRINSISPGGIFDQQPEAFLEAYKQSCLNQGMLNKTDINGTLIYLLSDLSLNVNGQNIIVDDGFTL